MRGREGLPGDAASCRKMEKMGVVEQLPSFGAFFGILKAPVATANPGAASIPFAGPATVAPSFLAVAEEDLFKMWACVEFFVALAVAVCTSRTCKLSAVDRAQQHHHYDALWNHQD